jgi:iron(III) transport system substrate-binding protein
MPRQPRRAVPAASLALAVAVLTGCGGGTDGSGSGASGSGSQEGSGSASGDGVGQIEGDGTLTLYNAQHQSLMTALLDGFTKETGITVRVRSGEDAELANLLVQEGTASPADVFVTENSPAMGLVDGKGGFAKLDAATLAQVPARFAAADGDWVGFAARSTVLVHRKALAAALVPASIMDLARPEWKDRIGFSPAGADFQAIVSAVVALKGADAAQAWLKGLKANAKVYQGNIAVMQAVNSGEIDAGIIYHYYWYRDQAESGQDSANTALHYFGHQDPGAFLSVSGAGVLKSTQHPVEAQKLVKYLTGTNGQRLLSQNDALEYSIASKVPANPALKPLSSLQPPDVPVSDLNGPQVVDLMQQAGLL